MYLLKGPRKPKSIIVIDGKQTADMLCCVHCRKHWIVEPGSGKNRGFCMKCMGPTCGPSCQRCVPYEKMIEEIERAATFLPRN